MAPSRQLQNFIIIVDLVSRCDVKMMRCITRLEGDGCQEAKSEHKSNRSAIAGGH